MKYYFQKLRNTYKKTPIIDKLKTFMEESYYYSLVVVVIIKEIYTNILINYVYNYPCQIDVVIVDHKIVNLYLAVGGLGCTHGLIYLNAILD